jgi:hypothetical protein
MNACDVIAAVWRRISRDRRSRPYLRGTQRPRLDALGSSAQPWSIWTLPPHFWVSCYSRPGTCSKRLRSIRLNLVSHPSGKSSISQRQRRKHTQIERRGCEQPFQNDESRPGAPPSVSSTTGSTFQKTAQHRGLTSPLARPVRQHHAAPILFPCPHVFS